jgi:hypothetical protein
MASGDHVFENAVRDHRAMFSPAYYFLHHRALAEELAQRGASPQIVGQTVGFCRLPGDPVFGSPAECRYLKILLAGRQQDCPPYSCEIFAARKETRVPPYSKIPPREHHDRQAQDNNPKHSRRPDRHVALERLLPYRVERHLAHVVNFRQCIVKRPPNISRPLR